jgi:hypothetical protein
MSLNLEPLAVYSRYMLMIFWKRLAVEGLFAFD